MSDGPPPLHIIVPGKPVPKERPRFAKGHAYTPKATREYEKRVKQSAIAELAARLEPWPMDAVYELRAVAYFADARRHDLDNTIKVVDSLNGVTFDDDKRIKSLRAVAAIDRANPRLELELRVIRDGDLVIARESMFPTYKVAKD